MKDNAETQRLVYSMDQLVKGLRLEEIVRPRSATKDNVIPLRRRGNRALPPEMQKVCGDGERTEHLTKLAGTLISQRRPLEEVIDFAKFWNSRNTPPLDDKKVATTCESIMQTHMRNNGADSRSIQDGETGPLFPLDEARVSRLLLDEPPPRRWLLKDCLLQGKVGAIVAPGGTGKSQALLQLGVSVASGLPFLGFWEVAEPGGVLILFAEDNVEEIHYRLRNIYLKTGARHSEVQDLTQRIETNLFVRSMVGEPNLMTAADFTGEVKGTGYAQRVVVTASGIANLKLIIIDPASRFRGGEENNAEDVTRFIEELEYLKKHTGATVLVAHHTNKGSFNAAEAHQNASRGSSAFSDGVRWQLNLSPLSQNEAKSLKIPEERRRFYLGATVVKTNYGPPSEPVLLERKDEGYLEKVDLSLLGQASNADHLRQIKEILRMDAMAGKHYTRTSFEEAYGGVNGRLKSAIVPLRKLLKEAVEQGKLFEDSNRKLRANADGPRPSRCPAPSDKTSGKLDS